MFYEKFIRLCLESGKKPNQIAKELNLSSGSITAWKHGAIPRDSSLLLLAEYFHVSFDYFSEKEYVCMFYNKFKSLCLKNGISPNNAAKNIGVSSGAVSEWKNGRVPHNKTIKKISDYFGVLTSYFFDSDETKSNVFWQKFVSLCVKINKTPTQVIQDVGMSKGTVTVWKNGGTPRDSAIVKICDYFGVPSSYFDEEKDNENPEVDLSKYGIMPIKTKKVPLLGDIACGIPIYAEEEHGNIILTSDNIDADFCLRAKGDSMTGARIQDGDIVFIHSQPTVENGEIAAVIIDDEATLKRFYFDRAKALVQLVAANPAYSPLVYSGEEINSIRVLGKAVAFQSAVK